MAFADQVQPQRFNERAFAHARHATNAQAQGAACVGQQGRQQFIALRTVVGAGGFQQGNGLGHGPALHGRVAVQNAVLHVLRCHVAIAFAIDACRPIRDRWPS